MKIDNCSAPVLQKVIGNMHARNQEAKICKKNYGGWNKFAWQSAVLTEHFVATLKGNELGIPEEELIEVSEVDEGFYSRATSATSHSVLSNSNHKPLTSKSQRRSGGSKVGAKEKEAVGESYKEHLSRKQSQRAMSENLELLSLKRLTLTSSQSLPKPGSHSLARTSTTLFSKSFEQVSGGVVPNNHSGTEANRFSVCSLQEENLIFGGEKTELPIPSKQPNQQRPPSISITLSID
uniref:Uncharacterized protein n=1 Tax=Sphaerodactylus townsendi TaxID=933632 RepID=A0ACB8FV47_9SAUR